MKKPATKRAAAAPDATAALVLAISALTEKASEGANNTLVQVQCTLEESQKLNRDLTSQLGQAYQTVHQQAVLIADLQKRDLDRDVAIAQVTLLQRRAEIDAQKHAAIWKTLQETGTVLLHNVLQNRLALPAASREGSGVPAADGAAETAPDPLLVELVAVLRALSPETLERIRAEAGEENVNQLVQLVVSRIEQSKAANAAPEVSSNVDHRRDARG